MLVVLMAALSYLSQQMQPPTVQHYNGMPEASYDIDTDKDMQIYRCKC